MGIFNEFNLALAESIAEFEISRVYQGKQISEFCLSILVKMKEFIAKTENELSVIGLRIQFEKIVEEFAAKWVLSPTQYFERMALLSRINLVLEKYPAHELMSKENFELRHRQSLIGTSEDGADLFYKIDHLSQQLESQIKQTCLSVNLCNNLQSNCKDLVERLKDSHEKNILLENEINDLQKNLSNSLASLREKIQEQDVLINELHLKNQKLHQDKSLLEEEINTQKREYEHLLKDYLLLVDEKKELEKKVKSHSISHSGISLFN